MYLDNIITRIYMMRRDVTRVCLVMLYICPARAYNSRASVTDGLNRHAIIRVRTSSARGQCNNGNINEHFNCINMCSYISQLKLFNRNVILVRNRNSFPFFIAD